MRGLDTEVGGFLPESSTPTPGQPAFSKLLSGSWRVVPDLKELTARLEEGPP